MFQYLFTIAMQEYESPTPLVSMKSLFLKQFRAWLTSTAIRILQKLISGDIQPGGGDNLMIYWGHLRKRPPWGRNAEIIDTFIKDDFS